MLQFPYSLSRFNRFLFWGCKNKLPDACDVDWSIKAVDYHFPYI